MADDDDDAVFAETEYLNRRAREAEQELRELLPEISEIVGSDVTIESLPIDAMMAQVVGFLRERGNAALATKYLAAHLAERAAAGRLDALNARHEATLAEGGTLTSLTADERAEWHTANDAAADALEEFERVQADVDAWLASLKSKGGA